MGNNDRFQYCCGCNEVHRVTPFDQAPSYELQGSHVREIPTDDRRRFMERHAGHAIEELSSVAEEWLEQQSAIDPMAESYIFVANGRYFFLLRRSRRSIADPIVYQVMPRRLLPSALNLEAVSQWMRSLRAHWLLSKARLRRKFVGGQLN